MFEGRTEMDYFDRLKDSKLLVDNLYYFKIPKKGIEQDMTDRMEMIRSAKDYITFRHTGKSTLRRYITLELSDFYYQEKDSIDNPAALREELIALRNEFIDLFSNHNSIHDGLVDSESELHKLIASELSKRYRCNYKMGDTDKFSGVERPGKDTERVFIVFDRDYNEEYFNHQKYVECIDTCEKLGYTPVVSSPKFELWMLMHFDNPDFGQPDFRPSYNTRITTELVRCGDSDANPESVHEKYISQERFDNHYRRGIKAAIEKSKDSRLFTTGSRNLMDHPGTDLGILASEIIDLSKI